MIAPAVQPPARPRPRTRCEREAIAAACEALGAMTNTDLDDMASHGESLRVRVAAALVLAGRETSVPPHPPAADVIARCTYGGSR